MSEFKPKLGWFPTYLINTAIGLAESFLINWKYDYGRRTVLNITNHLKMMIGALGDANPDDKEQIDAILQNFMQKSGFIENTETEVLIQITKLDLQPLRDSLTVLTPAVLDTIKALTDDIPANDEQIEEIWIEFLEEEKAAIILQWWLSLIKKKKDRANVLLANSKGV